MSKKKLHIIVNQHMDLVWRRCFARDIEFGGQNFVSYADLEEIYIKDNLRLCEMYPMYRFVIESVAVLEKFLQRNPDHETRIADYIRQKRIYISFTGHNIVDSNLISGESLVRNYMYGYHYLKSRYGVTADGADRNDAFGNSAQLPQIIRKFGVKWIHHVAYTPCKAPYWRGLDGSTLYNVEPTQVGSIGGYPKYRPCPVCKGFKHTHCDHCGDRRIDEAYMERRRFRLRFDEEAAEESGVPGFIMVGGEEIAPTDEIIRWAMDNSDRYEIEFTGFEKYGEYHKAAIDLVDAPPADKVQESAECNCNNTGVYVTRIKLKQKIRRLENSIFAAEALAAADYLRGRTYPHDDFRQIWDKTLFTMFHDAITSTHVDAGYDEICDAIAQAQSLADGIIAERAPFRTGCGQGTVTVFNPCGIGLSGVCQVTLQKGSMVDGACILSVRPDGDKVHVQFYVQDIGPYGTKTYAIAADERKYQRELLFEAREEVSTGDAVLTNTSVQETVGGQEYGDIVLENEFYRISVGNSGIRAVFDKKRGETVAKESEYKVGEWILELDIGSPWATMSPDMRRIPLARYTKIIGHERTADRETVTFRITPDIRHGYTESSFDVVHSVTLAKGVDRILFSGDVRWDTQNHRLRIAFPTPLTGRHLYDIPYGMLERKPYENDIVLPDGSSDWAGATGDYPAIHWAGIDGGDRSLALFNCGTPSYQINTDKNGTENIYLSVLRSPTIPNCLQSSADYIMTDYSGMMDSGLHHFDYALKSYGGSFAKNSVHADGVGYNARLIASTEDLRLPELPQVLTANAWISAMLPSQDRKGLILRVAEYRGEGGELAIKVPGHVTAVCETDLKEEWIAAADLSGGCIRSQIKPFEIKTFCLQF